MAPAYKSDLPKLCNNDSLNFCPLSSIYSYLTKSAVSNEFFVQRTRCAKTNQFQNVSAIKILNDLFKDIKDKSIIASNYLLSKLLKKHFLDSKC